MIVRVVTVLAALGLLTGCSTEEGLRAQELLRQAEAAQEQLDSSTFDGSMAVSAEGTAIAMVFAGATSRAGEWVSLRTTGVPGDGDVAVQFLRRGDRAWLNMGSGWTSAPAGAAGATGGSAGTMSAEAFQQLARHVKDVRVTEHQLVQGKSVTTIAGELDTQGLLEAATKLNGFAPDGFDLSDAGIELGDIRAVLTIDERTQLLDTAYVTFSLGAQGKDVRVELRYRLASANGPVTLPAP